LPAANVMVLEPPHFELFSGNTNLHHVSVRT